MFTDASHKKISYLDEMGISKYYCEYCDKLFNDTPESRKKHLESRQHKLLKKLHYDSFKGASI
jgi:hypothetical protein